MKLNQSIFLCAAFASMSLFVSCDKKEEAESSDGDSTAAVAKKDTPDSLTDEMIAGMNKLADAMSSAKDKESAEAAVKKIEAVADEFAALAGRMDKLETPTEEEKEALNTKMDKASEEMEKKMGGVMSAMMQNQEIAQIIGPAMQKFGERMSEHDKVFERFGKKK